MTLLLCLVAEPALAARPAVIVIYNGYGTTERARLWGRVLEDEGLPPPRAGEGRLSKLKRNLSALESDEIPEAELVIRVAGRTHALRADREGLFRLDLVGPLPRGRHPITASLKGGRRFRLEPGVLLVWPARPRGGVAVVSDIDDTVLQTNVTRKRRLLKQVLLSSALDLKTYPGAPELLRAWRGRGYPIVYVSGSPINLYTRLARFLDRQRFPEAPLLLKNLGISRGSDALTEQVRYKLRRIAEVQELLPGYQLLLLGDSGEKDPEIYAEVRRRAPAAVRAILIHRVTAEPASSPRFKGQVLFAGYPELARELVRRRQLNAGESAAVREGR